ncbi:MAG: hypothetical protein HY996_01995 [Micrococcales bacterium]|nr:hypothetical protein [Micrococcales bacterium]
MSERIPGRVSVQTRALHRVFAAVAAEQLGSPATAVSARVADDAGRLGVTVEGPAARRSDSPSLVRLGELARDAVSEKGGRIAGVVVGRVSVRITDAAVHTGRVS